MISLHDLYTVLTAVVPLYVSMLLAFSSVRFFRVFTPDQCSGINRFVAVFAVPLLSFHFISTNDPYSMNLRFLLADSLQKLFVLAALLLWCRLSSRSSIDWSITLFSLSTLPNTLVMGIPLLIAMYGHDSGSLMVQIVVLQCIIWYTLMLFLFEYRAARILINDQFPDTAASIVSFRVDSDIVSLDDALHSEAELGEDGKLHVTVRKSVSSRKSISMMATPRPSNLTGAEIYSLSSSRNPTPRGSNFGCGDLYSARPSSYEEDRRVQVGRAVQVNHDVKELHMFVWSANSSPVFGGLELVGSDPGGAKEIRMIVPSDNPLNGDTRDIMMSEREEHYCNGLENFSFSGRRGIDYDDDREKQEPENLSKLGSSSTTQLHPKGTTPDAKTHQMPPASVMTRLILIMVWRKLIRNPNTYSSLLGLVWSLVAFRWHVSMPKICEKSISILSDAGLGMAMFSLGLFMALQPKIIACGNSVATFAMAVRFLTGPAVMAVASIVVGLRGDLLRIAIVQAALPQGIVPFVFAKEYNVHPAILSTAVIFGMLIALPITLVYYIILGL